MCQFFRANSYTQSVCVTHCVLSSVTMTIESNTDGATTLCHMTLYGYVGQETIFS